jgi:hypothetical protein
MLVIDVALTYFSRFPRRRPVFSVIFEELATGSFLWRSTPFVFNLNESFNDREEARRSAFG